MVKNSEDIKLHIVTDIKVRLNIIYLDVCCDDHRELEEDQKKIRKNSIPNIFRQIFRQPVKPGRFLAGATEVKRKNM